MGDIGGGVSVEMEQRKDRVGGRNGNKVNYVRKMIAKKRKTWRNRMIRERVPKALQELFVCCTETFKGHGTIPSPQSVHKLCHILDNMKPEDVGLSRDLRFFNPENMAKENPRVTYTTIYKCDNFSLCIFFLPARGVIPLHNHPGMTVFRGNIHEFTAITPCAVLDVLGPPYSKEDGRDCSYYKDHPYTAFSSDEVMMKEGEKDGDRGRRQNQEGPSLKVEVRKKAIAHRSQKAKVYVT
ncbi:plant cysteine oxidase 2-like [Senna tora]|uniref:cysteine dioxygenase n=1 Tax=Senna tora TaxID=362788 RepID=A0A834SCH8_9FABA|nr:plant cysteine oxidase 2-like [Senna tora]